MIVDDVKSYRCLLVGSGELIHAYVWNEESAAMYDGSDTAPVLYTKPWLYDAKMDSSINIQIWNTIVDVIDTYIFLLVGSGELIQAHVWR